MSLLVYRMLAELTTEMFVNVVFEQPDKSQGVRIEFALRDILEVEYGVNMKDRLRLLGMDMLVDIMLETVAELRHIAPFQGQTRCIGVSPEVEQQIATALDG